MESGTPAFTHRLARRLPVMVRAAFYAITVSAAILAVLATSAGGPEGVMLMELSWYMVMLSFLAFLLMVVVNVLAGQGVEVEPDAPVDGRWVTARGRTPAVALDEPSSDIRTGESSVR